MKTILFFGSFNPIHLGHISIVRNIIEAKQGDEVWLVVSPQNPSKQRDELIDINHRVQMAEIAVEECNIGAFTQLCLVELQMPLPSYTVNTLKYISKQYPQREFILLLGSDMASKFKMWYGADEILSKYKVVVYPRAGFDLVGLPKEMHVLDSVELLEISSTQIRSAIFTGDDISSALPSGVIDYIKEKGLFNR